MTEYKVLRFFATKESIYVEADNEEEAEEIEVEIA